MGNVRLIGVVATAVVAIFWLWHLRDPHNTRLPFGSTDLTSVQVQLGKLPPDERALVESYVKRSHGDVLPPKFADPDNPLTARTFGEAIALEKRWQEKHKIEQAAADARSAARDAEFTPLRAVVQASVVKRELLSPAEIEARRNPDAGAATPDAAKRALPSSEPTVFAVTIALENLEDSDVLELKGDLHANDRDAYLPLQLCWIDLDERQTVSVRGRREIVCANPNRGVSAGEADFINDPPGRFTLVWEPRHIRLRNGTVLDVKGL